MSENGAGLVAAYVRVSSATQQAGMQRSAIERAARARGDKVGHWYGETFTGATMQRPELARLRGDVRTGHVVRLYVYRLDRLTRSGIRDTLEVVEELRRHGCELVSIADGFDVGGPAAEIVLAVLAWAAKMERLAIGERISAARARVEATGGTWGRPRVLTPFQERRIRELVDEGRSVRQVAESLGVPRTTIRRSLGRGGGGPKTSPKSTATKIGV